MEPSRYESRMRETLAADPDGMAVDADGAAYTWARFKVVADAVEDLLAAHRVPVGARIGLIGRNLPAHFAAVVGIFLANRCVSMAYAFQAPAALAADIAATRWPVLLGEARDWSDEAIAAAQAAGTLGFVFSPDGGAGFQQVAGTGAAPTDDSESGQDTAIELLSSGTTGPPKRIALSRGSVDEMIERTILQFSMSGPGEGQVQIIPWPVVSLGGVNALLPAIALGQGIAIQERFDAAGMLGLIRRYRPAFLSLPPVGIARIMQLEPARADLASVKLYFSGTAPLDPAVRRWLMDDCDIPVAEAYGATEFAGIISSWVPEDLPRTREKAGSVGRALPGIAIRIVAPDSGEPVPQGQSGLVEAQVPRVGEGWVRTNDVGRLDEEGFLFLEGRADDAIIRGGFKIVPAEIAELLRQHPQVGDAALIGIPDARSGSVPAAAVEPRDPASPPSADDLRVFLAERLPSYKLPARIIVVDEIPRTATLKPRREGLLALFA